MDFFFILFLFFNYKQMTLIFEIILAISDGGQMIFF